jgi:Na+-translocating ferredoxin:NAD+ oxidoreductase RnfC subunit
VRLCSRSESAYEQVLCFKKMDLMETAADRLSDIIRTYGIEEGGPGGKPPFHKKVSTKKNVDTVIINGTGFEPLVESDRYLLKTESQRIIKAIELIAESLGAEQSFIALNEKYRTAYENFTRALQKRDDVKTVLVEDFYPSGDELVLVYEITGRIVPEGGSTLDVRCIVMNVDTVLNIWNAFSEQIPVTRVFLTCAGELKYPSIVHAHIGVTIGEIISLCGGSTVEEHVAVIGGPLRGYVETDFDTPVSKGTKSVIVLPREHEIVQRLTQPLEVMIRRIKAHCYLWTFCTDFCPLHLLGYAVDPSKIMQQITYNLHDMPVSVLDGVFLCSECGICDLYSSTHALSPSAINSALRRRLREQGYCPTFSGEKPSVNEMRETRKVPRSKIMERLQISRYDRIHLQRCLKTDPSRVEIMLDQESDVRLKPVVEVGERVPEKGLIAEAPPHEGGAHIHASIDGRVIYLDEERIIIEK